MQNNLFRRTALNKLASPEQLDRLLQVTSLPMWLALVALGGLLAAALVWSIAGDVPVTLEAGGVLYDAETAIVFVPLDQAAELRPGLEVQVMPATIQQQQYGFLKATIREVSREVATDSDMVARLRNRELLNRLVPDGLVVIVELELHLSPDTPSGYEWSLAEGPDLQLQTGTPITSRIILRTEHPIDWVMGS